MLREHLLVNSHAYSCVVKAQNNSNNAGCAASATLRLNAIIASRSVVYRSSNQSKPFTMYLSVAQRAFSVKASLEGLKRSSPTSRSFAI